ncbi:hypothetical protein JXQ70_14475 [bacterium]|nr:hypothetical protein [bacterium]
MRLYSLTGLCFMLLFSGGCFPDSHSPTHDSKSHGQVSTATTVADQESEKKLFEQDPDLAEELRIMEEEFKKELGVHDEKFPSPPPGWNLDEALAKDDPRPIIYRWLDQDGMIQISQERPPADVKILGWRYLTQPTPEPTVE